MQNTIGILFTELGYDISLNKGVIGESATKKLFFNEISEKKFGG
jgi:hypothetical protein